MTHRWIPSWDFQPNQTICQNSQILFRFENVFKQLELSLNINTFEVQGLKWVLKSVILEIREDLLPHQDACSAANSANLRISWFDNAFQLQFWTKKIYTEYSYLDSKTLNTKR